MSGMLIVRKPRNYVKERQVAIEGSVEHTVALLRHATCWYTTLLLQQKREDHSF